MAKTATGNTNSSSIKLATGASPSDVPLEYQNMLQPIYSNFITFQRAFTYYCGAGSWPNKPTDVKQTLTFGRNSRIFVPAGELGIVKGSCITLQNNGDGTCKAMLASATSAANRPPRGIVLEEKGGPTVGAVIEIQLLKGLVTVIGGLTPGTIYYQSTTNGILVSAPPSGTGIVAYPVGIALGEQSLMLNM